MKKNHAANSRILWGSDTREYGSLTIHKTHNEDMENKDW